MKIIIRNVWPIMRSWRDGSMDAMKFVPGGGKGGIGGGGGTGAEMFVALVGGGVEDMSVSVSERRGNQKRGKE